MAGIWDMNAPIRPGMGLKFETYGTKATPAGVTGIVGLPITSDWGPTNEFVLLSSDSQYLDVYGPNAGPDSALKGYLVQEAFRGGASKVLAYRVDNGGVAALKNLADSNGSPVATALVLNAKYKGTRGNALKVSVAANAIYTTDKQDLTIYEGTLVLEVYTFDKDITKEDLVAKINARSRYVVAAVGAASADPLAVVGATSFASGTNGSALVLGDFTTAMDAFQQQAGFDLFTLPDIINADATGVIAAVNNWTTQINTEGLYVMSVTGGAAAEDIDSDALARATAANNENVVTLGAVDLKVWYPGITLPITRRTAAMTARVAGMIAAAGVGRSITNNAVGTEDSPVEMVAALRKAEYEAADEGGLVTFCKRGGRVVIEEGITTFTAYTASKDETFGQIKAIRAMHLIGTDFTRIVETGFIGVTNNTGAVRSNLISVITGYLKNLEDQGVIMPGSQVTLDDRFDNEGEDVYVLLLVQFVKELKRVLMTLRAPIY